jgi:hypothetical protein
VRTRATVTFEPDVAEAIERERLLEHVGVSEAVNSLIRRGLTQSERRAPINLPTGKLGLKIDVTCVEEALEIAEGPDHR